MLLILDVTLVGASDYLCALGWLNPIRFREALVNIVW